MSDPVPLDERDALAAELALGVLADEARVEALALAANDAVFAAAVAAWHERLAPLLDEIAAIEPGPALWARINAALGAGGDRAGNVVSFERSLKRWKGIAATMTGIAAALLVVVALPRPVPIAPASGAPSPRTAQQGSTMTTAIAADGGAKSFLISWSPGDRSLMVLPAAVAPVAHHSHQLWLIPEGGKPISLGVISAGHAARFVMTKALATKMIGSATLAVSAEPEGGSPTGQPTGPVIGSGKLTTV